jgi:hypothetical protein
LALHKTGSMRLRLVSLTLLCSLYGQTLAPPAPTAHVDYLAGALNLIRGHYGIPVSFEDVSSYEYAGELTEWPPPGTAAANAQGAHDLTIPRYSLAVDLPDLGPTPAPRAVEGAIQAVLDQHAANGNPGRFKLIETPESIVVVPTERRNAQGSWVPDASPLDLRITFPEADRSADDAIQALCDALRASWGPGGRELYCITALKGMRATVGAKNEVARDVLVRLIANARWIEVPLPIFRLAWTFGPFSQLQRSSVLTLGQVQQVPDGLKRGAPVSRDGPLRYDGLVAPPGAAH